MFVEGPSYQILALLIRFEAFYIISFNRLKITVVGTVCTANLTSRECKGALQILFGGLSAKGGGGTPPNSATSLGLLFFCCVYFYPFSFFQDEILTVR